MTASAHPWLSSIVGSPSLDAIVAALRANRSASAVGAQGSTASLVAGALALRAGRPVLLVVAHLDDADDALDDLELFAEAGLPLEAQRFGALEVLPGESSVSLELLAERLSVVERLATEQDRPSDSEIGDQKSEVRDSSLLLVAPIQALMQSVPLPSELGKMTLLLVEGAELSPSRLIDWLAGTGYERVEAIEQPGQFAVRGGIIDIFPPAGMMGSGSNAQPHPSPQSSPQEGRWSQSAASGGPIRLDYFGDQIETIRRIDPETMGSANRIARVQIIGASAAQLQSDELTTNLLSLLPSDTVIVLQEVLELSEQARGYFERLTNPRGIYAPRTVFQELTKRPHVEINQYSPSNPQAQVVHLPARTLPSFDKEVGKAMGELTELASESRVIVLCSKEAERDRLVEIMREHAPGMSPGSSSEIALEVGYLHRGFVWESLGPKLRSPESRVQSPESKIADKRSSTTLADSGLKTLDSGLGLPDSGLILVPHHELFHRYQVRRRLRRVMSGSGAGVRASDAFLDIAVGDFVVHVDHGIARFLGLRTMRKDNRTEEYLTLEFAGEAKLHVPATQIDLVQKYVGGFHGNPPLSMLGGKRWQKQKEQVAEAVKDMAAEMLRIQAARASLPGVRYPADTNWQKEFEAEFPFEETQDQLAAISQVKRDMSDEQPMDRLICGDVGFGKTEVAIRAAFKAAEYGKQVAVLVPTTILAEQHERTFRGRMADYPFRVESVSRFKTGTQMRDTLKALSEGRVDIIIGTHRLLSEDVKFADLGLVIIDEEQRFGVEHKHKLLALRMTVDVLTLSATPIPRTLHMSMLGLRDISSLSTPPMDRRAIVTEVIPYDRERVKRAIARELNRDGQVYFVHNRVFDIQSVADEVQKLAPKARIVIGHGQMPGHELEEVMVKFVRREADILVCTTIIESGLDIATANTMFIDQADHFGLADLHQLRGRVGRYKHRAYCYLILPDDRPITDTAQQRLRAIEQYAMLGAGFKIAMRDLEIRGAGNLLGAEQSGHIAAVGYEMYCQLLEQATRKLKQEQKVEPARTHLELPMTGQLPKAYIASDKFRMEAYRRIGRASTLEELDAVAHDLTDAYGAPPPPARMLIDLTELRIAAGTWGVEAIKLEGPDLIFRTPTPSKLDGVFTGAPGRASVIDANTVYYRPPTNYLEPDTLLAVLRKLLARPLRERVAG